ncbi:MAG TPA: lysylphosphatidylglycerol synthase transmembrane domain-containing protein [Acidimicrobiales bacterium]
MTRADEPESESVPVAGAERAERAERAEEPAAQVGEDKAADDALSQRLAERIEQDSASPVPWRALVKGSIAVVVAGITIYLVFPSVTEVFASWPKLTSLDPIWFTVALAAQVAHFTCTIWLQRIALRTKAWFSVATSQLAGNAISLVVPGGAAVGAATQFRMLAASGNDTGTAVGGLTAFSLLGIAGLLALPVFVLPAILLGVPIDKGLEHAALIGIVGFVLFAGFGAVLLTLDGPLRWAGRVVQSARNRWKRKSEPLTGLPDRLVFERNRIRDVLGRRWKAALLLSSGRIAFDYFTLLAAIRATGAKPQPALVLLAYSVAGLLALIPLTPGGLGIVEAGLSGLLILAGVGAGDAVVATLGYRVISYWLPIAVGPFAYLAFRLRYGPPAGGGGGEAGAAGAGAAAAA